MKKLLVIDDNLDFLGFLTSALEKYFEVYTATGVKDALRLLEYQKVEAICSDYNMKDGTGLDLLEDIRHKGISVPFLLILADERYMGTYVIGKREVTEIGGHKMRSKEESDWIKIPNHHIPLVNEEIFSKANASIQRFKIPNRKKHNYLLRGKVICGCCKHALHLANGTSYRCRFSSTIPSLDCYNIHIREKELNQLVYELLCKQFQVAFGVDSLADLRKVDTVTLRQADFDRQIFELQEEKRKLYESLVSGGIPLPKYKEQKEQISERLLEVQNTKAVVMARLEAEQEERQHQRQQMDISRMLTESDGLTSELVDLLIDKIYVYPDKRVDVEFKIRDSLAAHK